MVSSSLSSLLSACLLATLTVTATVALSCTKSDGSESCKSYRITVPESSRYRFLASSSAAFLTSTGVMLRNPGEASAKSSGLPAPTPRFYDYELEMKYADGPDGNPRTRGVLVRRFTGDSTPFKFPVRPVRLVQEWPEEPPFAEKDFSRSDVNDDSSFYMVPRFVYHIDEPAVAALTQYYRKNILPKSRILDVCSSWVSHYPVEFPKTMKRIAGTGMNKLELLANDQLTDREAKDLNLDTKLPYSEASFDVVTIVVSIDYLVKPIEVLREVRRVLRPGGKVIVSQSNRCFPSKAVNMWLRMNDRQHLELINGYFQYAGGFKPRTVFDITATNMDAYVDPMFVVEAVKV